MKRLVLLAVMIMFGLASESPAADLPMEDEAAFDDLARRCAPNVSKTVEEWQWCKGSSRQSPDDPASSREAAQSPLRREPPSVAAQTQALFSQYLERQRQDAATRGVDVQAQTLVGPAFKQAIERQKQDTLIQSLTDGLQAADARVKQLECRVGLLEGFDPRVNYEWQAACESLSPETKPLFCHSWRLDDMPVLEGDKVTEVDLMRAGRIQFVQCLTPEASKQWRRYIHKFGAAVRDAALSSGLNQVERDARLQDRQLTTDTLLFLQQLGLQQQLNDLWRQRR